MKHATYLSLIALPAILLGARARAAAREAKASPDGAAFLAAARALQKAQREAEEQRTAPMEGVLEAALATLAVHASEAGLRMPQPRERKAGRSGRRPRRRSPALVPPLQPGFRAGGRLLSLK